MTSEYFTDDDDGAETPSANSAIPPSGLLSPVRDEVVALNEDTDPEALMLALGRCKNYIAELREFKSLVESAMIERIKKHGPIEVRDGVRYIVGADKTVKCNNVQRAMEAAMEVSGGDWDIIAQLLSSGAIKPGAAKKLFTPEVFCEHFTTAIKEKIVEGKTVATKKLIRLDEAFVK